MSTAPIHSFYRAFEDRYRGNRDLIRSRLESYLPFLLPLIDEQIEPPKAFDIGCGRGEWLELVTETGFDALGVDLDAGMLSACQERSLNAVQGDAIEVLSTLPADSMAVISAFHVVEHIPFDALQRLMSEALRVLRPGGLLILETPNPDNLVVGTSSFYLDPSHQRPIPSLLLSFLAEYAGFGRRKILGLQEDVSLRDNIQPGLFDVIQGVSPDYAVIAQKNGSIELLAPLDLAFTTPVGLHLHELATRYDAAHERKFKELAANAHRIEILESNVAGARQELAAMHAQLATLRSEIAKLHVPLHRRCLRLAKHKIKLLIMHGVLFMEARALLRRFYRALLRRAHPAVLDRIDNFLATQRSSAPSMAALSPRAESIAEIIKQHNKLK